LDEEHARIHELSKALAQQHLSDNPKGKRAGNQEPAGDVQPGQADVSSSEQALATQERMLETGEENPIS
jgi:hypothetical protein